MRVAVGVASCVYYLCLLSCNGVVHGRSLAETLQDGWGDSTAIAAAEEKQAALAARSLRSMQLTGSSRPGLQNRRSLHNVYVSPDTIGNVGGGTSGMSCSTAGLVIVLVLSSVFLVLSVVVLVFWCCCKKRNDVHPDWRLLGSFKCRKPETDDEKELYAKGDKSHLTGILRC